MKPAAKKRRLKKHKKVLDDNNLLPDYSLLPTEILLKIFGYAKGDLLKLTKVCKRFDSILASQLTLVINAAALENSPQFPTIKRGYRNVVINGREIASTIAELLTSSKETARSLYVGCRNKSSPKLKIYLRTLMLILKELPNLEELQFNNVNAVLPTFEYDELQQDDFPILNKLKIIKMTKTSDSALKCLEKVNSIEQLSFILLSWHHKKMIYKTVIKLQETIAAQAGLKILQTPWCLNSAMYESPSLEELILDSSLGFAETIDANQKRILPPALKKLTFNYRPEFRGSVNFLALYNSASVEELQVNSFISQDFLRFKSKQLFENFPALKMIKTFSFKWNKSEGDL